MSTLDGPDYLKFLCDSELAADATVWYTEGEFMYVAERYAIILK